MGKEDVSLVGKEEIENKGKNGSKFNLIKLSAISEFPQSSRYASLRRLTTVTSWIFSFRVFSEGGVFRSSLFWFLIRWSKSAAII
jgi:hypothetical protein